MLRRYGFAIVETSKPPWDTAEFLLAHAGAFGDVPLPESIEHRHIRAVLVQHGFLRTTVEAGKVIEHNSPAIYSRFIRRSFNSSTGQIPSGHIMHGIAQNHAAGEIG